LACIVRLDSIPHSEQSGTGTTAGVYLRTVAAVAAATVEPRWRWCANYQPCEQ
jgi:hypothetical protein